MMAPEQDEVDTTETQVKMMLARSPTWDKLTHRWGSIGAPGAVRARTCTHLHAARLEVLAVVCSFAVGRFENSSAVSGVQRT